MTTTDLLARVKDVRAQTGRLYDSELQALLADVAAHLDGAGNAQPTGAGQMADRGYHELQCDANKLNVRLGGAVDAQDWLAVNRLCEQMSETSFRLYHEAMRREGVEKMRQMVLNTHSESDPR
jgi:hypothetical protein